MKNLFVMTLVAFSTQMAFALSLECNNAQNELVAYSSTDKNQNVSLTVFLSDSQKIRFSNVMMYDSDSEEVNLIAANQNGEEAFLYLFADQDEKTFSGKLSVLKKDKTDETISVNCQVDLN